MKLKNPKLPKEARDQLRRVPMKLFPVNQPLPAPVYLYLPRNEKYVAVKGPLAVFQPQELDRYSVMGDVFVPAFVDSLSSLIGAAEKLKNLFRAEMTEMINVRENSEVSHETVGIPLAPALSSDALLRILAEIWSSEGRIDPFFINFFVAEICGPLPPDVIAGSVEKDVERFEVALLRSSLTVFLALHLGWVDSRQLSEMREWVFRTFAAGETATGVSESMVLARVAERILPNPSVREVSLSELLIGQLTGGRIESMLRSRLSRLAATLLPEEGETLSFHGAGGILDG